MSLWIWSLFVPFVVALLPLAWLAGKAVGMEEASWRRAAAFATIEAVAFVLVARWTPVDITVLKAMAGLFAALFISPLLFRALMTDVTARAILGSILLAVGVVALSALFLLLPV